ncbi:hypothetical protein MTBUT4_300022 [Magnetospirillum sp. UT-4]|nr:hypothetical protein MTBUT4_300022 [Magnetospirillum sp. UT-4]
MAPPRPAGAVPPKCYAPGPGNLLPERHRNRADGGSHDPHRHRDPHLPALARRRSLPGQLDPGHRVRHP